jgi:hypothetical protein
MQVNPLANLIHLNSGFEEDRISFESEEHESDEGFVHPSAMRDEQVVEEICAQLGISHISSRFIPYVWEGQYETLPWNEDHNVIFDPRLVNVIVPSTGNAMYIKGEGRKIVLTYPATYKGYQPFYFITCASEQQADGIRVLDPSVGNPFYGLERIFTQQGFESLPKLEDMDSAGILSVDPQFVIVPQSSDSYL